MHRNLHRGHERLEGVPMGKGAELTPERMLKLCERHGRYEYAIDLDGTMSTIGPDPVWEVHPFGIRIVDRESVRHAYKYQLEHIVPRIIGSDLRSVAYGDHCCLRESTYLLSMPDGRETQGGNVIVFEFDDNGLISSERGYTTGFMTALVDTCFPSSVWDLPGVSHIWS
jgi:hypothetical protein